KSGEGWSFGLANAFLLAGCTHYVGVLSELLDTGSKDFARLFYRNIIAGLPVGKALYEARHEHRRQNPGKSLTWAQYVLYGDPDSGIFGTMRTESGTVTSLPIQGREMNERREEKRVIVSVDLARYSEIVASLEQRQGLGPNATRAVEDQIKGMLREGCAQAGSELDDCLVNFAGDGSILAFASAVDADLFAEGLFAASSKWNSRAKSPEEYRCFRMGVYAGRVVIEEGGKISGGAMSAAVRLQQRAGAGEVLLGANAYEALPESRRLRFGEEELIPGKEHDDPFPAHRRRLAEPAPWEPGPEIRKPGTRETSVPGATRTSVEASIPAFQAAKPGRKAILVGVIVVVLALCGIVGERTLDPMGRHHQRALALLMEKADQYEGEQNYSAAEAAFSEILRKDPENALAKSRLQGIRSAMARVEEKERVESTDKALTNLEEAIKANPARLAEADRWTSRPLSLAVLGFDESGGAPDSSSALGQALPKEAESLLAGMGFTLVTRERIVEVMREQRLAASDAADPRNSARLGGLLAARILVSGRVSWTQDRVVVELQAIDAEKGILLASTRKEGTDPTALMASLVSDLGAGVRGRFPLQGKVQLNGAGKPGLNIGSKLGVRPDQLFEVFPAAPNPRFEDTLGPSEPICVLRVSQLGEDSALCEIVSSEIPPEDGMRAREKR
ncbi:MAG: CHAT domain-containing protein, partial [Candidatus Omnitrophica bacterium]|nr:CHAT domain-containing protein [Candidatus Omnitrophota bacterium]